MFQNVSKKVLDEDECMAVNVFTLVLFFSSWSGEPRSWDSLTSSTGMLFFQHSGPSWLRNEVLFSSWQECWLMSLGSRVRRILHNIAPRLQNKLWKCNNRSLVQHQKWCIVITNVENTDITLSFFSLQWFYYKFHEDLQYYKRICLHAKTEQSRTQEFNKLVR